MIIFIACSQEELEDTPWPKEKNDQTELQSHDVSGKTKLTSISWLLFIAIKKSSRATSRDALCPLFSFFFNY